MDRSDLAPLSGWCGRRVGPVELLASIDSTNAEALRRIDRGDVGSGAILLAHRQTAARGSHGRVWHETDGRSLAATVAIRWPPGAPLAVATWLGAVAVTDLLGGLGLPARIKWPNDVLVGERKIAGILAETRGSPFVEWVALGIGLNVGQDPEDFLPGFVTPPTSLWMEGRRDCSREQAARGLFGALDRRAGELRDGGVSLRDEFARRLGLLGRLVRVSVLDRTVLGPLAAIEIDGTLAVGGERLAGAHVSALREV